MLNDFYIEGRVLSKTAVTACVRSEFINSIPTYALSLGLMFTSGARYVVGHDKVTCFLRVTSCFLEVSISIDAADDFKVFSIILS